jgi:hypothetical protein
MAVVTGKLRGEPLVAQAIVATRALLRAGGLRDDTVKAELESFLARTVAALPPVSRPLCHRRSSELPLRRRIVHPDC